MKVAQIAPTDAKNELIKVLKLITDYEQKFAAKRADLDKLEAEDGADFLAEDPEAIQRLASLSAEVSLLRKALAGAQRRSRELALIVSRESYRQERALVAQINANIVAVEKVVGDAIAKFFPQETWPCVLHHAPLVWAERNALDTRPGGVGGDPNATELHPGESPERVLDGIAALERAALDASARAKVIAKLS